MGSVAQRVESSPSLWRSIREAIRGGEHDFTQGNISRAILLLSIPMVLEMSMESLFAVVDVFFVARLGAAATATVGLTEAMMTLVYSVAMGLSLATTAMVARRVGEKNHDGAATAAGQAVLLGFGSAAVIAAAGVVFARDLLELMGAEADVVSGGHTYTMVIFAGTFAVMLLFLINAIFRGAGDAVVAMKVLWLANSLNIVLDPCLIFGLGPFPELGLTGAAVATTIGRGTGVIFQIWLLFGAKNRIRIELRHLRLVPDIMWRLVRVSLSGMGQLLVSHAAWVGLVRVVAIFGSAALAGYTIAIRILVMVLMPAFGVANAAATLVGQNLGAKRPDRAESSVWKTGVANMVFLGSVGLIFVIFAEPVVRFFTDDPEVVQHAALCLRCVNLGNLGYAWGMVVMQSFNGAGDTNTPLIINLFCYWLWQIPLGWLLAVKMGLGPLGVYSAIVIAEMTLAAVAIVMFRRGKWKEQTI